MESAQNRRPEHGPLGDGMLRDIIADDPTRADLEDDECNLPLFAKAQNPAWRSLASL